MTSSQVLGYFRAGAMRLSETIYGAWCLSCGEFLAATISAVSRWLITLDGIKVYARAKQGSPDALKAVGDDGKPARNPVCRAILEFIGGGK